MDESEEGNSTLKDEEETRSSSPSSISELGNFYLFFFWNFKRFFMYDIFYLAFKTINTSIALTQFYKVNNTYFKI